jgi:hypothetical protein
MCQPDYANGNEALHQTNQCFSKKIQNHAAMVAIHAVYYNFARIHKMLKIASSMTAGLSDLVWSLEEIVMMADNYLPKPGKRGPFQEKLIGGGAHETQSYSDDGRSVTWRISLGRCNNQTPAPEFTLAIEDPIGRTIIECGRGCVLQGGRDDGVPSNVPTRRYSYECGALHLPVALPQ